LSSLLFCVLAAWPARSQPLYYNNSSATLGLNTLDSVATNGSGGTVVLTATGVDFNKINRCTAVAVDALNGRLFFIDGPGNSIWSVSLGGTNLALVKSGLTSQPTDLALDVLNEKIYFTTSSAGNNSTVQRIDYTGSNSATIFSSGGTSLSRCTALAVDLLNSKIFVADSGAQKIWSLSLTGTGLTPLATTAAGSFPSDVALDVTNQVVYFTTSSTVQDLNTIQHVSYSGSGLTTRYSAAGSVLRCTALDLDLGDGLIYLSDAGAKTLWRMSLAANGGSPTAVLGSLPATAKKVRWFSGPTARPSPALTSIRLSGTNVVLNAANGFVGGTYYVLTSTNLTMPLNQWLPLSTNVLGASGSFTLTASNGFAPKFPRQFYVLQVQ
jgi:hypothetical protein